LNPRVLLAVGMTLAMILAFVAVVLLLSKPFDTGTPRVSIAEAYWDLGSDGYALVATISTSAPIQLLAVDAGKVYHVAYDIFPPNTTVRIPVDAPAEGEVKFHFSRGSPTSAIVMRKAPYSEGVTFISGDRFLFIYGALLEPGVVFLIPVKTEVRVGLIATEEDAIKFREYISRYIPEFSGDVVPLTLRTRKDVLKNYTTLIFADVTPTPDVLEELLRSGKAVVLTSIKRGIGEKRLAFINGTARFEGYSLDRADIDYFGAHCLRRVATSRLRLEVELLRYVEKHEGRVESYFGVVPSPYCLSVFVEVHATTELGDVVLGRARKGFFFASIELRPLLLLAMSGFFEGEGGRAYIEEVHPFRGLYPLKSTIRYGDRLLATVYTVKGRTYTSFVEKPPITFSKAESRYSLTIGVDRYGRPVWSGEAQIKVVEASYSGDVVDVVIDGVISLPFSTDVIAEPFMSYLIYLNNTLISVIADESTVANKPRVSFSYSSVCEMFYLTVNRLDSLDTELQLYINGRVVAVLPPGGMYKVAECRPGRLVIEARDPYGRVVARESITVGHIYEQPLFILGVVSAGAVFTSVFVALKRRAQKEVEEAVLVFYKLPETERTAVTPQAVIDTVHKLKVTKKAAPRVSEVIEYMHRKYPLLKTAVSVAEVIDEALSMFRKRYGLLSRYVVELDDTITVIGEREALITDLYTNTVVELLKKFGGLAVRREDIKDLPIVDVDLVVSLGKNMALVTYAPTIKDLREAVDRAITSFVNVRRARLPYRLIGVAVLTEPKHVSLINSLIDDILSGDREKAAKVFRDMTVFTRLTEAPKDEWLSKFIMTAVPITRLAPFLAFTKAGAVRICNKYYRLTVFTEESGLLRSS